MMVSAGVRAGGGLGEGFRLRPLCFRPRCAAGGRIAFESGPAGHSTSLRLVEPRGFEPLTSSMPLRRSTN